ncbi:MAG: sensor histidine kinase [Pirellulaceae bacterium]
MLDADASSALLTVEDNGCGISPEIKEQIWTPFFTTKGEQGNGLGLDICRELVQAHQGRIWCESQAGRGSSFFIRLPRLGPGLLDKPSSDA